MAKDKSEKKEKKTKEVVEETAGEDVEMADVEVHKVSLEIELSLSSILMHFIGTQEERERGDCYSSRRSFPHRASTGSKEATEEASQNDQEG